MASVRFTPDASEAALKLPRPIRARLLKLVERLKRWPNVSGAKPLRARLVGHYRLRTGDYRVQFHIEGDEIVITKVGHRDRFYEE